MNTCTKSVFALCAAIAATAVFGCTGSGQQSIAPEKNVESGALEGVVARVNGVPILDRQVRDLIESVDGGLSEDEAVDALIKGELLASEAKRRGWGTDWEVKNARKLELAKTVLRKEIGEGVTLTSLDQDKLKRYYEQNKLRFVHGLQRRVINIVAIKGKDELKNEQAEKAAARISEKAKEAKDENGFKALAKPIIDEQKDIKIKVEDLPPFSADDKLFVSEFIKAAFAVPGVGKASGVVKTKYGWHVIFVAEEIPPINRPFEEVKDELSAEVLPAEREIRASDLLDRLYKEANVFIYENAVSPKAASE